MKPNKLELSSVDRTQLNLEALYQIAPSCFTEVKDDKTGELRRVVNFTALRQLLGDNAVEDTDEMYQFTWPGKQEARREAARPTTKTLRPVVEDSVDWDNTQNLYIEGDNLEVLKLLQKSYMGKVKMIYIDPPYNTGNDFVYDDDFAVSQDDYDLFSGDVDELGNRYRKNTDSNGRFHSDWCSMMYPRLMVARSLLAEDGVIFISIGQGEVTNIVKECDEIFGSTNRISIVSRLMKSGGGKGQFFSPNVEYIIIYAKSISNVVGFREEISEEVIKKLYTSIETEGARKGEKYRPFGLYQSSLDARPNQRYFIECPDGSFVIPPGKTMPCSVEDGAMVYPNSDDGCWRWSRDRYLEEKANGNITFKKSDGVLVDQFGQPAKWNIYTKIWLADRQEGGATPVDLITKWENRQSAKELSELGIPFDFAKPIGLIRYLIALMPNTFNSIILDFFSGSSTTAHAVMQLNSEDGGNRKYIMVQLPEETPEDSEARKAGYDTIPEIAKERIRRAGKKIKEESPLTTQKLDTGFRVFRLADSNFEEVKKAPEEYDQSQLDLFLNNVKSDRTDLDLLFGAMLSWGVQLSLPMTSEEVDGKMIYSVNDGDLVACFADDITENIVKAMADKQPLRVLFRDSCFVRDDAKINVFETLKQLLDWSEEEAIKNIKVI
jgi:adenine-specific DNA-methyltransferase